MTEMCPHCHQEMPIGQSDLTEAEVSRLPTGNQNSEKPSVIEWKAVKGAADFYGVRDWTSKVDGSLSYEENIELMRRVGTNFESAGGQTMKELAAEEKANMRWSEQKR